MRKHTRTSALWEFLFSGLALPALVLLVMSVIWLPWVVAGTVLIFSSLYVWDTIANPIHIQTIEDKNQEKKSNWQALAFVLFCALSVVVYLANGT